MPKKNVNFDFIIWTGDSQGHDEWRQESNSQFNNTIFITNLLKKEINKPLYAIFGNHEFYPCDQMNTSNSSLINSVFEISSELWKPFISKQA